MRVEFYRNLFHTRASRSAVSAAPRVGFSSASAVRRRLAGWRCSASMWSRYCSASSLGGSGCTCYSPRPLHSSPNASTHHDTRSAPAPALLHPYRVRLLSKTAVTPPCLPNAWSASSRPARPWTILCWRCSRPRNGMSSSRLCASTGCGTPRLCCSPMRPVWYAAAPHASHGCPGHLPWSSQRLPWHAS